MITDSTVCEIRARVETTVSPKRLRHIQGVVALCDRLCRRFALSPTAGAAAAWGHDLAREWPESDLLAWALRDNESLDEEHRAHPVLLHGPAAAAVLRAEYQITDRDVLSAVRHHTLGRAGMSSLEMVLYVADYCEEGRPFLTDELRAVPNDWSLPKMVLAVASDAGRRGFPIARRTTEMVADLTQRLKETEAHV
ncbi:MAG: HD domain-containing protein [Spirochaetaceae bacterium]|nr:MAG: HD domain-containing protein [Spirochaetaceae bacterium]